MIQLICQKEKLPYPRAVLYEELVIKVVIVKKIIRNNIPSL